MADQKHLIRRSALLGPWGVGAIIPFPDNEFMMIAGLDRWEYNKLHVADYRIIDERLMKRLHVHELRWPPDYHEKSDDPVNADLKIPAVRFPTWYYCPYCGSMKQGTLLGEIPTCDAYQWDKGLRCNPAYKGKKMIPERFVTICEAGHIDDFPIAEWVHEFAPHPYQDGTCRIRRSTGGSSASLTGVFYTCTCGASRSMKGAFKPKVLNNMGCGCRGSRPWLGQMTDKEHACQEERKVVLRGATRVWFADICSSIVINVGNVSMKQKIYDIVNNDRTYNFAVSMVGEGNKFNLNFIRYIADENHVDQHALELAFLRRLENNGEMPAEEEDSEDAYRFEEYNVLVESNGGDQEPFHSVMRPIATYNARIRPFFESITLVHKLQETRAFVGFYRDQPRNRGLFEQKRMLRLGNEDWLPAIQVNGEGIFFRFNAQAVKEWASRPAVIARMKTLQESAAKRKFGKPLKNPLRAEYVLIHTFAHLLINQLSFECGYGSSALRERLYCEMDNEAYGMYGCLIYTADGDSEGSMGGLVRQGKPGRIEDTIVDAVRNAEWCSMDPVCIQSLGQGPDSCNLAACHNCALLPETSCEGGNRYLDRGMIVGTLDDPGIGFFRNLLERD